MKILEELRDGLDYEKTTEIICSFIKEQVFSHKAAGLMVGISGGLDSATVAFLGVKALGVAKVQGLFLPDRDTAPESRRHAEEVAAAAGIAMEIRELTPVLEKMGCYRNFIVRLARNRVINRLGFQFFKKVSGFDLYEFNLRETDNEIVREAIEAYYAKFRLRMKMLFERAREKNLLLPDTFNRTESMIGFSLRYGDIDGDFAPILPLYKTQVRALAAYLGVPSKIISRPPTPDLIPGITDEMFLDISYEQLDAILFALEKGLSEQEILPLCQTSLKQVKRIKRYVNLASTLGLQRGKMPHPELGSFK